MSNFRIKTPLSNKKSMDQKEEEFTDGADNHTINKILLDKKTKPTKSFTVPLNDYELGLLRQLALRLDRSQRYVARKVLVKTLEKELEELE
jgi:hypothetical protein